MKHAEQVTFGGSGLNRSAHQRTDPAALAQLARHDGARYHLLWRGKVLMQPDAVPVLPHLASDHPLIAGPSVPRVFLGTAEDGAPHFACDISDWAPDAAEMETVGAFHDPSQQQHPDLPEGQVFCELRRMMTALDPREAELAATARALFSWHETHRFCARCGAESEMVQGGWQRTCPSCGGHHFPRTDPVVIMLITHGNSVLMGRSPGWPEGMYSLLAGFVEPGETLEAAVRREVAEEAGVPVGQVSYLASQPWPFPASLMVGCAGEALSREIAIDPAEIEDALWVTRSEMLQIFAGESPEIKPARAGSIAHFLIRNWLADRLD
ncbi:MAG: NAD(+) diphosphatase [Paracoccaceae bacterium]